MADRLSNDLASLKLDREASDHGSPWLKRLVWLAVIALLGGGGYYVALPRLEAQFFKPEVLVTEISTITPAQASVKLTSSGYVVAQISSDVGPVVAGRVKSISIQEGDVVKAGQVIAILENSDRKSAISAARSQVTSAEARAQVSRADLAAMEIKAKRERALAKEGVSAPAVADDLEAQIAAQKKVVEAADAQTKAARAEVRNLQVNLDYMTVTAPIDGTVVGKPVGVGAMVGPFVGALAKLVDLGSIMVETDVPEGRVHALALKAPTEILLDAFPGKRLRGEVAQIGPRVDRAKATVTVKVKFVDAADGVLPDMAARVNFLGEELSEKSMKEPPKVVVPGSAVTERAGAKVVFVIDGGRVRMRPVTLGPPIGNGFELVEGPPSGTRVVKDPPKELADGKDVKERQGT
ncbi:MAG: efflux RND transporter periplasmic adaptor subunit [Myxococcales bacterium]|nr:efflux RND transporter periplasmic adaptor subunit [Myxococcales bacterium]